METGKVPVAGQPTWGGKMNTRIQLSIQKCAPTLAVLCLRYVPLDAWVGALACCRLLNRQ